MYFWTIDKDLILEDIKGVNMCSHESRKDEIMANKPHSFSLYDDDDTCYAVGRIWLSPKAEGSEQEFAPLDDFGMPSLGCTYIKIDGQIL
jgi:hypothetical protein